MFGDGQDILDLGQKQLTDNLSMTLNGMAGTSAVTLATGLIVLLIVLNSTTMA
jgi:hypothetical protein